MISKVNTSSTLHYQWYMGITLCSVETEIIHTIPLKSICSSLDFFMTVITALICVHHPTIANFAGNLVDFHSNMCGRWYQCPDHGDIIFQFEPNRSFNPVY